MFGSDINLVNWVMG
ncbi:hypothetical protein F383_14584 [Gossypium arboreum]|uniref:Uncharacterized protein n=1 Tax=Gossypium arboreum TaxID=29729 RepID=A0A0B0MJ05_GOSAR|nr:hypothetical protein F383_38436 [Gossypium arboreum]KHG30716.1 hypothetical protein F383_14584 [Gossypium arboreum]